MRTNAQDRSTLEAACKRVNPCDRCGACLAVCPLFNAEGIEATSARGKNAIVRALAEGGLEPSPEVLAAADLCLLCGACVANCPSQVRTDEAMIDVRQYLTDLKGGPNLSYRAVGGLLKQRPLVRAAAAALTVLRKTGLNRLFPHGMVPEAYTRTHFMTAFAGPAALGRPAPPSEIPLDSKTRVAYFRGCGMEMMFPHIAADSLALLEVTTRPLLRPNVCCGLPHLAHGMRGDFLDLAKRNIALFEDTDCVVTDCASCGGTLKHLGTYLAHDPLWSDRAKAFSGKVMDLTEYLHRVGYRPGQRTDVTFTFHDPCHLARGQGIRRQPRDLLEAAGRFVDMKDADVCCGGAGSFHMDHPEVSARILQKKQEAIEATGAAAVVTACPGCLIMMTKAAKSSGRFQALHISQVL